MSLNTFKILVLVKTGPKPSKQYQELVCTAGITEAGDWIRLYPVPFRYLPREAQFKKYDWIEVQAEKNQKDKRVESFRPTNLGKEIKILGEISTEKDPYWSARKQYIFAKPLTTLCEILKAYKEKCKENKQFETPSLAVIKPHQLKDFKVELTDPKWKPEWQQLFEQEPLFEEYKQKPLEKIPFTFSYEFLCSEECRGHTLQIEDWEIFELARKYEGQPELMCEKVKEKYWELFKTKDLSFFIGTTKEHHTRKAHNPFIIIGCFYPAIEPPSLL